MGRWSYSSRGVVERQPRINIQDLIDRGILKRGPLTTSWEGVITDIRGVWSEETARVNYKVSIEGISPPVVGKIVFETKCKDGRESCNAHLIETQPVHFGGFRYYFRCTLCGRLVKAIYYGSHVRWACRTCCGLVYESSRKHRGTYALQNAAETTREKAARLRAKGHPRQASRLEAKADEQERVYEEAWTKAARQLVSRIRARNPGV